MDKKSLKVKIFLNFFGTYKKVRNADLVYTTFWGYRKRILVFKNSKDDDESNEKFSSGNFFMKKLSRRCLREDWKRLCVIFALSEHLIDLKGR